MDSPIRPARRTLFVSPRSRRAPGRLLRWHRRIGAALALWLLFLCVSGILLNHGNALGLDRRHLDWSWLLSLYGMQSEVPLSGWRVQGHYLSQAGGRVWLDDTALPAFPGRLVGAVSLEGEVVLATGRALTWLGPEGGVIDQQDSLDGLPSRLLALGLAGADTLAVRGEGGVWLLDPLSGEWRRASGEAIRWSSPQPLPGGLRERLARAQRGDGPSIERLLLDLHSGRIFARTGTILADLAAILLGALALSGLWMWWPRRRRRAPPS